MEFSTRIDTLNEGGSDGWELFYRARALKAAGEAVIELTVGEHDVPTHPEILTAMHAAAAAGHTGYAMVPGVTALRRAVAERVAARTGVPTRPENVLVTPGGQAGLFAAHMALCDPGDRALYLDPYYATYPGTIRATGAEAVRVETRAEDGFQPRAEAVAEKAEGARSLLVNTPNNPTGAVYRRDTLEALARVAEAHDLWIVSDEVYDTQVWAGAHVSPRQLPGMAARTLVVGSMSKSHAMTGSRLGWIVGPEPAIERLVDLATVTTYGVPGYIQDAGVFALSRPDLEEAVAVPFRRRRALARDILGRQQVVGMVPADGAMYVMLDIRHTGLSGIAFAEALLDAHRIAVMPGESFGHAAAGHVRVAMTVPDATFAEALDTICAFAAARAAEPA